MWDDPEVAGGPGVAGDPKVAGDPGAAEGPGVAGELGVQEAGVWRKPETEVARRMWTK